MLALIARMADGNVQIEGAEVLTRSMALLSPRTRRLIELRYGLCGNSRHTLSEVAQRLNLTKMRVCQLEHAAIRLLAKGKTLRIDIR